MIKIGNIVNLLEMRFGEFSPNFSDFLGPTKTHKSTRITRTVPQFSDFLIFRVATLNVEFYVAGIKKCSRSYLYM